MSVTLICTNYLTLHTIAQSNDIDRHGSKVYAFVNGNWFDGKSFIKKTFFTQNGILTSTKPHDVDSVIDLTGKYIIPPFGEAHNHNVEWFGEERFFKLKDKYLKDGGYYIKNPNNAQRFVAPLKDKIIIPESIDVAFENGSFTHERTRCSFLLCWLKNISSSRYRLSLRVRAEQIHLNKRI